MEWLIAVVVLGSIWFYARHRQAREIVRRRSRELSHRTGIPAGQIEKEMRRKQLTPGEWAMRNGLDPITFEPQESVEDQRSRLEAEADELWQRVRLDGNAERPGFATLERIGELHGELVGLLVDPAPLLSEMQRSQEILRELHTYGARVDAEWVNARLDEFHDQVPGDSRYAEESPFNRRKTQEDFDRWQQQAVEQADAE